MVEFLNILERCKELSNSEDKLLWAPDTQKRFSVGASSLQKLTEDTHSNKLLAMENDLES